MLRTMVDRCADAAASDQAAGVRVACRPQLVFDDRLLSRRITSDVQMKLAAAVDRMSESFGLLAASVVRSPASLETLLAEVGAPGWSAAEFMGLVNQLQPQQASNLLVASLHRSRTYASHEFMPLKEARALVDDFIDAAMPGAVFYSTNRVSDEPGSSDSTVVVLTDSVFETVVYCAGVTETALLLITEDD